MAALTSITYFYECGNYFTLQIGLLSPNTKIGRSIAEPGLGKKISYDTMNHKQFLFFIDLII